MTVFIAAYCRVLFAFVSIFAFALTQIPTPANAAGALAVGKCGAYGQAYDYPAEDSARTAALKQCKGICEAVVMKRA